MEYIQKLNDLFNKQSLKNKLNKGDSQQAYKYLQIYLEESDHSDLYNYLMTFAPEVGMSVFAKYLKKLDGETRKVQLSKFFNSELFKENRNNMSTKRGMALVALLYKEQFSQDEIEDALVEVCRIIMNTTKSGINSQIIENVSREFIDSVDTGFFENYKVSKNIDKNDFCNIEQIFCNVAFQNITDKVNVSPKKQLSILYWLMNFNNTTTVNTEQINIMINKIRAWLPEFKRVVIEDGALMRQYKIEKNQIANKDKEAEEQILSDTKEEKKVIKDSKDQENIVEEGKKEQISIQNKESDETSNKQEQDLQKVEVTDSVSNIDEQIDSQKLTSKEDINTMKEIDSIYMSLRAVKEKFRTMEKDIETTKGNYQNYKCQYNNLKMQNAELIKTVSSLKTEINEEKMKNIALNSQATKMKQDLEMKNKLEEEYKIKMKILHETNNMIDNNSLQEFKNKLAGKLSNVYQDFMEVRNELIDPDMGEILKIKMDEIFKELQKQGIKLS
ncbi:hypothetical protein [Alkaliphilus oremlandii]|uniref:Uncharacterized protein n=1 Tax=Alkaliphilus oremlandii (strain OhILAs) TaxID=350688 RepID=A8MIE0_ALKOO|nr:hypothetical protein [Alkaliphilus oremlandii]ABW19572.1 hypothetical protein Clos_2035 [Alkaliphilus oremlandii OhILAs]